MLPLIAISAAALVAVGIAIYYRRKFIMSQASADRLTAAAKLAADKIASLEAANATLTTELAAAQAATGVPDSTADAASAELEQAVNPPATDPSAPPATT